MGSRSRLLKAQHFAEDEAWCRYLNPFAPVVYERRLTCKLKHSPNVRIAGEDTPTRSSLTGFGSPGIKKMR